MVTYATGTSYDSTIRTDTERGCWSRSYTYDERDDDKGHKPATAYGPDRRRPRSSTPHTRPWHDDVTGMGLRGASQPMHWKSTVDGSRLDPGGPPLHANHARPRDPSYILEIESSGTVIGTHLYDTCDDNIDH